MEKFAEFLIDGAKKFSILNESEFLQFTNFDDYLLYQTGCGEIAFENEAKVFLSKAISALKGLEYLPFITEHIFEESNFYPAGSKFFYYENYFCIYNDKSFWYIDKIESYYDDIEAYNRLSSGWQEVIFSKSFYFSCKVENLDIFWIDSHLDSFCIPNDKGINYCYRIKGNTFIKFVTKQELLEKNINTFIEYALNKGSSYFIEDNNLLYPFFSTNNIDVFIERLNNIFNGQIRFEFTGLYILGNKKNNLIKLFFEKEESFYNILNLRHIFD